MGKSLKYRFIGKPHTIEDVLIHTSHEEKAAEFGVKVKKNYDAGLYSPHPFEAILVDVLEFSLYCKNAELETTRIINGATIKDLPGNIPCYETYDQLPKIVKKEFEKQLSQLQAYKNHFAVIHKLSTK